MATTNSSAPTSGTVYRRLLGYAARQWPLLVLAFIGMGVEAAAAGGLAASGATARGVFIETPQMPQRGSRARRSSA